MARAAPEARTGGNSRWRGAVNFQFAPSGAPPPLILFGGETSVAFVLAAKLGRGSRRENGCSLHPPLRSGEGRGPKRRGEGCAVRLQGFAARCASLEHSRRAALQRVDLPPPGEGDSERPPRMVRLRGGRMQRERNPPCKNAPTRAPTSQKYRDRYYAASDHAGRAYCDFFGFWRACPLSAVPARPRLPRRLHRLHRNAPQRTWPTASTPRGAHVRARIPKDAGGPERDAWMSEFCTATWAKSPRKKSPRTATS